ncbi:MAG: GNAT family N-acetyltransferase, partial [Candidatus Micrarchaeota archaeon]|nr:GNAT family N-acetyltransferase [Candidatus Micrarchaeota archaeon]
MTVKFSIERSKKEDAPGIIKLVNDESKRSGAVLRISEHDVSKWRKSGFSIVAKAQGGQIIGHLSAYIWPESKWIEFRSSVVKPQYRGNGINSSLTKKMMELVSKKYKNSTLVAFTNKAGAGQGTLLSVGFTEADYNTLPEELFSIGP